MYISDAFPALWALESEPTKHAILAWEGDSRDFLGGFPEGVRQNLGFQLWQLQQGERPTDYRPLPSVGTGVFELRDQDERAWYRVVYVSRINDVIHVLHCFEKKSREIPRKDFEKAKQRLKSAVIKPRRVTRGNILDDLGFTPEQATALKFKAELYQAILKYVRKYRKRNYK